MSSVEQLICQADYLRGRALSTTLRYPEGVGGAIANDDLLEATDFGVLLGRCFREHVRAVERAAGDFPHGFRGYQVVASSMCDARRNQAELGRCLKVDRTVMVYLVDDLEKAGLVARVADPTDRRSRLIVATESGAAKVEATHQRIAEVENWLLRSLSEEQRDALRGMLATIVGGVEDHAEAVRETCDLAEKVSEGTC
jgi:MarR family transcriptional regulator for hemolysin